MKRIAKMLLSSKEPPVNINYLKWGTEGYDLSLKSGTDIRDLLTGDLAARVQGLTDIINRTEPLPADWIVDVSAGGTTNRDEKVLELLPCSDYKTLVNSWRKAMRWIDGLDHALTAMLASITSTKSLGSQLWLQVISPPSTGKSTLCEALSVNREYVIAKSTLRGFHSGFIDKSGENHSPLAAMLDKTLVIKDGDTLLQAPNLPQILSEGRDIYDRTSRSSYRSTQSKDWMGINLTIILCGTSSLHALDQSELGERFLRCIIMDEIDDELENEVLWRIANRADRNLAVEADGKADSLQDSDLTLAMQLTGGYVEYLRKNAQDLLSCVTFSDEAKHLCTRLGKFVAFMRARPSTRQDEIAEREFAARLVEQLVRLAKCIAVVMNCREVDDSVMKRVTKIAMDTSRGQTMEIVKSLYEAEEGLETRTIAVYSNRTEDKTRVMLRFLSRIKVIKTLKVEQKGVSRTPRWGLTPQLRKLYEEAVEMNPVS
jgi:hypothetical protein